MSLEDRFWPKVNKAGPVPEHRPALGPCWLWTGSTGSFKPQRDYDRYGTFYFGKVDGKHTYRSAHRVSYFIVHGRWPEGDIDHLCDIKLCINPLHLEDVTTLINVRRSHLLTSSV